MPIRNEFIKQVFGSTHDRDWMNPIAMSQLKVAVKRNHHTVVLNGTEFTITYLGEKIRLNPVRGFVPMGFFRIKDVLDFEFEEK